MKKVKGVRFQRSEDRGQKTENMRLGSRKHRRWEGEKLVSWEKLLISTLCPMPCSYLFSSFPLPAGA
jgi:hypothetical protein